jgi:hypothetical protein
VAPGDKEQEDELEEIRRRLANIESILMHLSGEDPRTGG